MIYFLSDAHLGSLAIERGWAHQKKLIDLLEEMSKDAVSIYMLGDMFDFWMEYFIRDKGKHQYDPFFKELDLCCKAHNGLWNPEAEKMIFEHFGVTVDTF